MLCFSYCYTLLKERTGGAKASASLRSWVAVTFLAKSGVMSSWAQFMVWHVEVQRQKAAGKHGFPVGLWLAGSTLKFTCMSVGEFLKSYYSGSSAFISHYGFSFI